MMNIYRGSNLGQIVNEMIANMKFRVEMPQKGSTVEFCDGQNQFKVPFMMYADFELILEPIQGPNPEPTGCYTS